MKDIEVELKFPLKNESQVIKTLGGDATKKGEDRQIDSYFDAPQKSFLSKQPITEWLRVRETARGAWINYKNWHNTTRYSAVSCDELETKIDNPDAAKKLLIATGFKKLVIVDKNRKTWMHRDVEVAIDDVKNLGSFIELEAKGDFKTIDDAKKHLYEVLKGLGAKTGEQDFFGYPHLMLKKVGLLK